MSLIDEKLKSFQPYTLARCKDVLGEVGAVTAALAKKMSHAMGVYLAFFTWKRAQDKNVPSGKVAFLVACGVDIPKGKKGEDTREYDAFRHLYRTARKQLRKALYEVYSTTTDTLEKAEASSIANDHGLTLSAPVVPDGSKAGKSTSAESGGEATVKMAFTLVFAIFWQRKIHPDKLAELCKQSKVSADEAESIEKAVVALTAAYRQYLTDTVPNWAGHFAKKTKPATSEAPSTETQLAEQSAA